MGSLTLLHIALDSLPNFSWAENTCTINIK